LRRALESHGELAKKLESVTLSSAIIDLPIIETTMPSSDAAIERIVDASENRVGA
jgi:hypothetical protein